MCHLLDAPLANWYTQGKRQCILRNLISLKSFELSAFLLTLHFCTKKMYVILGYQCIEQAPNRLDFNYSIISTLY